jgi:hypothetical protein
MKNRIKMKTLLPTDYFTEKSINFFNNRRIHPSVSILNTPRAGLSEFDSRHEPIFFLRHCVQTGSGAHTDSYPMDTMDFSPNEAAGQAVTLTTHHS